VALASEQEGKATVIVGISKELTPGLNAGELVARISARLGGKGGGRPDMAQGGGPNATALPAGLAEVAAWVAERL
jgi:alanyl-tRNA synthetase